MFSSIFFLLLTLISADIVIEEFAVLDTDDIEDQEARMTQFGIQLRKAMVGPIYPPQINAGEASKPQ